MVHIPFQTFSPLTSQFSNLAKTTPYCSQPMKRPGRPVIHPQLGKKTSPHHSLPSLGWILCSVVNVSAHRGRSRSDPGLVTARVCSGINQSAVQTAASGLPVGEAACTTIWNLDTLHLLGQWIRVGALAEKKARHWAQQTDTQSWMVSELLL